MGGHGSITGWDSQLLLHSQHADQAHEISQSMESKSGTKWSPATLNAGLDTQDPSSQERFREEPLRLALQR